MQCIVLTLLSLVVIFVLSYLISIWISGSITGKYYDNKTKELGWPLLIVPAICCSRRCMRASCYLLYILCNGNPLFRLYIKFGNKAWVDNYYNHFGKIDYRALARRRDWVLASILWGSCLAFLVFTLIACLLAAYLRFTGVH
jgi:hypothetical protein